MKKITFLIYVFLLFSGFTVFAQPANDDCSGAITIAVNSSCVETTVTFDGTETDSSVPPPGCAGLASSDLWYKLVIPATGAVRVETNQSSPLSIDDGAMAIYTGPDCNNLTLYECSDDSNPSSTNGLFERITVVGTVGSTIYVRLWEQDAANTGTYVICAYETTPPANATNDDCDTAISLNLNTSCNAIIGTTFGATSSSNVVSSDPTCANYAGDDVWFKVVIPNDKDYDIAVETYEDDKSITDGGLAIYSEDVVGNCLSGLTEITCDDDSGIITTEFFERIELFGRRNETLYVRFWSFDNAQTGTFNICATDITTLSIDDVSVNNFKLYPNPAKDIINIKLKLNINDKIDVNIYNIQGKLVLNTTKALINNKSQIDIASLKSGMYFLKIFDGEKQLTKKLMVN